MMSSLLSVISILKYVGYIFIAVLVLLLMVLIHELGHYVAGKILKFKINEFSVGFGPKILQKKKKNGEVISLRAFPLGGYCAFEGENEDGSSNPEAFNNQKPWKRLIVLFSGAFFNFLSAIIFSFILLLANGYDLIQVKEVNSSSINYEVLQKGDIINGIQGTEFNFVKDEMFNILIEEHIDKNYAEYSGEDITNEQTFKGDSGKTYYLVKQSIIYNVERDEKDIALNGFINVVYDVDGKVVRDDNGNCVYTLFSTNKVNEDEFFMENYKYSFGESLIRCVPFTFEWAWKCLLVLGQLVTGQLSITALTGPVGTVNMIADFTQQSASFLFVLLPLIAVNLAVMNLLPIPALDGFQMIFTTIEWVRKKPIKQNVVNAINNIGLFVLLGFVIIVDVLHFFIWWIFVKI